MTVIKTGIDKFLEMSEIIVVIDVRSPSEYETGHIPGAVNIPLFDDAQRAVVGTLYKKEGRNPAIISGLELIGPSLAGKLKKALDLAAGGKLLVYCARGGMRSETMAWLFSLGGIETMVLEGGYKNYRNHILNTLSERRKMIILGGMTGSGKTFILKHLRERGLQVTDLEAIACHKGSAFGSLGQSPQPSTEHFANLLFDEWRKLDPGKPVWLEDESRNIGTVFLPELFYNNMQTSKTIVLKMDIETRLPRLLEEYSIFPPDLLKASITRISKRLGGDNTTDALLAVDEGNFARAITITLRYYDKAYLFSVQRKKLADIIFVETDTDDVEANTVKVLEASKGFESVV